MGAELGVGLICTASKLGVEWGAGGDGQSSIFSPPRPPRRLLWGDVRSRPPPEGSGRRGRLPRRPRGSLAPSCPHTFPEAGSPARARPPASPRRLCRLPLLGNQVTNVKPIPERNSTSSTPHPPSSARRQLPSPPALSPRRRCQGRSGRCSASGLPWAWGSSASQVRRARPGSGWTGRGRSSGWRRGHMPLPAPPSPRSHASCPHLEPGAFCMFLPPTHPGDTASPRLLARPDLYLTPLEILGSLLRPALHLGAPVWPGTSSCSAEHRGPRIGFSPPCGPRRPDLSICRHSEALFPPRPRPGNRLLSGADPRDLFSRSSPGFRVLPHS